MKPAAALFGAGFTSATAIAIGLLLLRALRIRLRRPEQWFFAFVAGSACLSLQVFLFAAVGLVRTPVFLVTGLATIAGAVMAFRRGLPSGGSLPPLPRAWRGGFFLLLTAFGVYYSCTALAPEASPDGSSYHLGYVARWAQAHGFYRVTTDMYAWLSAGAEMLFLYAFAFGRHSAAALTHFCFYLALPLGMVCYGRRFGVPRAAATGALLVFMSPIVGFDGSTAYVDVALACVLFALFYLLQIWDAERDAVLLIPIGLLAGFAYAVKYTGFLALPYAVLFVGWKVLRSRLSGKGAYVGESGARLRWQRLAANPVFAMAVIGACALVSILPWMARNWVWVGNPLAPFYNAWFPNPYYFTGMEQAYRRSMAAWGNLETKWAIPLEATVSGLRLQGLLGPSFLLLPLGLLALRRREGRQLLLAALVFGLTYPQNLGTRFLIPMLPFAATALGLVVAGWKWAAPLLLAFHALTAWPMFVKYYCHPWAMRVEAFPIKAALRLEPESEYLRRVLPNYEIGRMVEMLVPPGGRVLSQDGPPMAYTRREVLVSYKSAPAQVMMDSLAALGNPEFQPVLRHTFRFEPIQARGVRILQNGRASWPDEFWSANEITIMSGARALERTARWRIGAHPNPWGAVRAFDGNPMTRWRTWETLAPGAHIEVDFGRTETIDAVELVGPGDEWSSSMSVEVTLADGRSIVVARKDETETIPAPADMRRLVTSAIKREGVNYLLVLNTEPYASDMMNDPAAYNVTLLGEQDGVRLYRID
ncbi:MAG: discoidin domain-containing protein [bacterium]|jgi:hypothetical protein